MYVKIIERPTGAAPDWVRDAWVGLTLPLATPEVVTVETFSVKHAPRGPLGLLIARLLGRSQEITGYSIRSKTAVEILAAHDIQAAEWWIDSVPNILEPHMTLMFNEAACAPS